MKRIVKFSIIILFVSCVTLLISLIYIQLDKKSQLVEAKAMLPDFSLSTLEGNYITSKDLDKSKPTLLVFLSLDCQTCMEYAWELNKNYSLVNRKANLLVIIQEVIEDSKMLEPSELNHLRRHILIDKTGDMLEKLKIDGTPHSLIFDLEGHFKQEVLGVSRIEYIVNYLE